MKNLSGIKIKKLHSLLAKTQLEKQNLQEQKSVLQSKIDKVTNRIKKYEEEIEQLTQQSSSLIVSEHALLRYLERVYKLDLQKIEKEILPKDLEVKIKSLGNGTYSCGDSYSIKVKNNVVVSVLEKL